MSENLGNLEGIQFIRSGWMEDPSWDRRDEKYLQLLAAEQEIGAAVRNQGGTIVSSREDIDEARPWYRLDLDYENDRQVLDDLTAQYRDRLRLLPTKPLSDLSVSELDGMSERLRTGEQFVFAYTWYARGHGKYLIEHPEQLDRIRRLTTNGSEVNFARHCEMRPYVDTPSDHDTSLRIDVSASGQIISAALAYSAHTKENRPVVVYDRWDEPGAEDEEIRFIKAKFEDPHDPHYLHAQSPRSNVSSGGGYVPLIGSGSRTEFTVPQRRILESHHIDPDNPEIPAEAARCARFVGKTFGRFLHPVLGIDFLPNDYWLIDINPNPSTIPYAACWPEKGADLRRNTVRLRLAAIATFAAMH